MYSVAVAVHLFSVVAEAMVTGVVEHYFHAVVVVEIVAEDV